MKYSVDIAQLINDYNLYKQGIDLLTQLTLLSKGLNIPPKIFATVTDSHNVWMTLLKEEIFEFHHQFIKKKNRALKPFHCLAYLMYPVYKGENFTTG